MENIEITNAPLESIDLEEFANLSILNLGRTNVKNLDLSKNSKLVSVFCNNSFGIDPDNGLLETLNLSGKSPSVLKTGQFSGHANLKCVLVDNGVSIATSTFTNSGTNNPNGKVEKCI